MKTALITGASSGIGKSFAEELAQQNYNLVIVARSSDKLLSLKQTLTKQYSIQVEIIIQDLTLPNASQNVFNQVKEKNLTIDLLINNAGFGDYGEFGDRQLEKQTNMIQLNVVALVELTHLFLTEMRKRKEGGIINVASIAGYLPLPYMSVYAATKAFVLNFSLALWAENKEKGIKILTLSPGATESNFFEQAEFPMPKDGKPNNLTSSQEVVKEALKALNENKADIVTGGLGNQIMVNSSRFVPKETLLNMVSKQFNFKDK